LVKKGVRVSLVAGTAIAVGVACLIGARALRPAYEPPIKAFTTDALKRQIAGSFTWITNPVFRFESLSFHRDGDTMPYSGTVSIPRTRFGVPYEPDQNHERWVSFFPTGSAQMRFSGTAQLVKLKDDPLFGPEMAVGGWITSPMTVVPEQAGDPYDHAWSKALQDGGDQALYDLHLRTENFARVGGRSREEITQIIAIRVLVNQGRFKDALLLLPKSLPEARPTELWAGRQWDAIHELSAAIERGDMKEVAERHYLRRYLKLEAPIKGDKPPDTTGVNLGNN
jgi:hypothetical protein